MNKQLVGSLIGIAALCAAGHAGAHDPQGHEHESGEHGGVYDHGHTDGHHHHPHAHTPAPRPATRSPYGPYAPAHRGAYPTYAPAKPHVIEGWEPGDPVPDGYRQDTRSHSGLIKGGAATLFSVYGLSVMVGSFLVVAEDEDAEDGVDSNGTVAEDYYPLFIPVAGPFVTIATAQADRKASMVLVANGIAQTAGLAMFVAGLAFEEDVLIRIPTYGQGSVELAPVVSAELQGVGVNGSF